jgi:hypothetical protein
MKKNIYNDCPTDKLDSHHTSYKAEPGGCDECNPYWTRRNLIETIIDNLRKEHIEMTEAGERAVWGLGMLVEKLKGYIEK